MKHPSSNIPRAALVLICLVLAGAVVSFPPLGSSQQAVSAEATHEVILETGVRARMRDGVSLVADIYRPGKPVSSRFCLSAPLIIVKMKPGWPMNWPRTIMW
jgi:predicted acyl esterase